MPTQPSKDLETFDNPFPDRDYIIEIETPEFTCLCPKTGQPDFADLYLKYVPDQKCVELKALKLYFWSYRNQGAFHEAVTNTILDDLVAATNPRYMSLRASFYVRGGIYTTVEAEYRQPGWQPGPQLPRESQELPARESTDPSDAAVAHEPRFRSLGQKKTIPATRPAPTATADTAPTPAKTATVSKFPERTNPVFLGIDLGTSGCRIAAIDSQGQQLASASCAMIEPKIQGQHVTQDPQLWWQAVNTCLGNLFVDVAPQQIQAIAVDGTSGTLMLCDKNGAPVSDALMYNDARAQAQSERIAAVADANCGCHGAASGLAKLMWLQENVSDQTAARVVQQTDWITAKLSEQWGHSDYNNCLKLGYDVNELRWPEWLAQLNVNVNLLPLVHAPGAIISTVSETISQSYGLLPDTKVMAGTTDGVAAFLATGANQVGQGVTSLGSTLVLKLLSQDPVFSPEHGVYSHKLGNYWLAGGASNTGGAVLLQYFGIEQLQEMSALLNPDELQNLNYYPLPGVGERFPINDPSMAARLEPLPSDSVSYFQGILEGISHIEAQGYKLLTKLGGPVVTDIKTTGGGSKNPAWQEIRQKILGIKLTEPRSDMAAFGTALIAAGIVEKQFQ